MNAAAMATLKELGARSSRRPAAALDIMWGGSPVDNAYLQVNNPNRAALKNQVIWGIGYQKRWAFCDTEYTPGGDDLNPRSVSILEPPDGIDICAMPDDIDHAEGYLVGWWGRALSDGRGYFEAPLAERRGLVLSAQTIVRTINISGYRAGDAGAAEWPVDFSVTLYRSAAGGELVEATYSNGNPAYLAIYNNTSVDRQLELPETVSGIAAISLLITRWSHSGAFIKITSMRIEYSENLRGDALVSLSLLEETEGAVGAIPVGQVSSNSLDLSLQNVDNAYSIGNDASPVSDSARINRRVAPSLGFYDDAGNAVLCPKGLFWTGDWNIELHGATASVSARDRLGMMQDIEYAGRVGSETPEATYWINASIHDVAVSALEILRQRYMPDLEFDVDGSLARAVPLAFFSKGSWFDVIKSIAAAGGAYAYMDTPTDAEIAAAERRGNSGLLDILRIKSHSAFYAGRAGDALTLDDIITQNVTSRHSDLVNAVNVSYMRYAVVDGAAKEAEGVEPGTVSLEDYGSVRDYGRMESDYPESTLIQSEEHARELALLVLGGFAKTQRDMELTVFGDVTRRIGDIIELPEFQRYGLDKRGDYAVSRITTEYGGGLSQTLTCRRADGEA